jgi:hypothetical protein
MQGKTGRMDAKLWRKPKNAATGSVVKKIKLIIITRMHFSFRKYSL